MVEELMGTETLVSKRGKINAVEATSKTKLVGFLFLTYGCPFTTDMTNCLIGSYNKVNAEKKVLEIIYCHQSNPCQSVDEDADL